MAVKGFTQGLVSLLVVLLTAVSVLADCGHIVTWSEADRPDGSDWSLSNNEPTTMCTAAFPNMSPSEEGGPRTCFLATYTCGGVWLNFKIISYLTDAEARSVYDVFRSDPMIQKTAGNDFGNLISVDGNHLSYVGGTYVSEQADYATMSLYAVYRGCLVKVERTRGYLPPATPPLDVMKGCFTTAYAYAKGLIDAKCGTASPNHPPEVFLGSTEAPPFSEPLPPSGSSSSFWIALYDFDGVQDLDIGKFNASVRDRDVTGTFISRFREFYNEGKVRIENLPNGLKVSFSRLSWVDVALMLGTLTGTCTEPGVHCENLCSPPVTFRIRDKSGAVGEISSIFKIEPDGPRLYFSAESATLPCSDSSAACATGPGGAGSTNQVFLIFRGCTGWADLDWAAFRVTRNGENITQAFLNQLVTLIVEGKMDLEIYDYQINVRNLAPLTPEDLRTLFHFFGYGDATIQFSISDRQGVSSEAKGSWTFTP